MNSYNPHKLIQTWLRWPAAAFLITILFMLVGTSASATLAAYEPFNYTAGTLTNGTPSTATGFTGNWTVSAFPQIVNTVLTYSGLTPTNQAYQHAAAGAQTTLNLANSISNGTKYISYLFKGSGNSGADTVGVFFKGNNATSLFCGFRVPNSASLTGFGLGTVNSTSLGGASALGNVVNINNTATHFIVLKIDFDTSGANDTVSLWIDPPANAAAPGVGANVTTNTFDVGIISAFGINITGGYNPIIDEIRIGDSYGDVTAYLPPPDAPTGLSATAGVNSVSLSWNAVSGATGYKVLRGTASGIYTVTNNVASNTNYDATAVGGTTYFYVVQGTNSSGVGASSTEVSATPTIALPAVPTGLTATGTNSAVILSWAAASGASGYNIKRSTTSGAEVTIATVAATGYTDTAVVNGTTYFYKVSSTNTAGESSDSSEVSTTPNNPPAAPTGLTATAGSNQVALAWTGSAGAVSYNIKRSTTSGSGYITIGTTTAPAVAYTDSTAVKFTHYYYVVSAVNAYGESADSSPEADATPTGAYGPSAYEPFNYPVGTLTNGTPSTAAGFTGNWTVSAFPQIVNTVLAYPNLPTTANAYQHAAAGAQTTVNLASALSNGTKYISFLFKGSGNSGGDSVGVFFKGNNSSSLFVGFRAPSSATDTGFGLGTVSSTTLGGASALGNIVNINNTATHLIVLAIDFNTAGANDTVSLWIDPPANAAAPGVGANVTTNTFDVGIISAFGINITGGYNPMLDEIRVGDVYGDVVTYVPTPDAPTGLSATAGVNSVSLSWNAVSGATGYKVLRGTSTGVYTVTNNVASNTNYDSTAVGGTTYFYVVQGTNSSGVGASSSEVSATPTIALPAVPTGLTATGTNSAVILSWSPASGASGYNVKRSTTSGAEVTIATAATANYTDSSVLNGITYFYKVSSTNSAGESADSSEASATPNSPPAAPAGLTATAGSNQVALTWTGSAGAISYNIKRSTTSGSGYSTIGTTTAPTVAYTDSTAVKFTHYYYVVSAVNGNGESPDSSPEADATPTGVYAPTAYEPFNYTVGTLANGTPSTAAGFTGNWTVSAFPQIVNTVLTYPNLPTSANAYQHAAAGAQTTVNLASPLTSGTKYISFLFQGSGNSGGDSVGVFFKGNNANSLFVGFRAPFSGTDTGFGLGTVSSASLGVASALGSVVNINNTATHFIVVQIDFNTSGANDTISLWIDPPAGVLTPGIAADVSDSTFDVGTISAFGINITGGYNPIIDEIRVGDVYGDVVGVGGVNLTPMNIVSSVSGDQLSLSWPTDQIGWTLQSKTNTLVGGTWHDLPGSATTNQVTVTIDPLNPTVFFRLKSP